MDLNSLNKKKIAILGLGLENRALLDYLLKHRVKCEITVCDARTSVRNRLPVEWRLGRNFNRGLERFDYLFRSPGWPIDCPGIKKALLAGVKLSSPMKLFFDLCPTAMLVGVTGTKGKGTTASLIYEILRVAGKKVWLGGNIGVAPFAFLDKIKKNHWVVLELSSFQLEDLKRSPRIAVITNFYSEHLAAADPNNPNYHKTLKAYAAAKLNIIRWQKQGDWAIVNSKSQILNPNPKIKSKKLYFSKSDLPSRLVGEHNKENIAAAVAAARLAGAKEAAIKRAVANFKGLPHRLELVGAWRGVKYYDDSFATTPESTITALKAFNQPVILFLGGADKGANFKKLAAAVKSGVKYAVLLAGQATPRIKKELLRAGFPFKKMATVKNLKTGIKAARDQAEAGDVILLSTACASFGMFKNYKERGDLFKAAVRQAVATSPNKKQSH